MHNSFSCVSHWSFILRPFFSGGKKYATTIDTLTQREPDSMLAAMFSGRHTVSTDDKTVLLVR